MELISIDFGEAILVSFQFSEALHAIVTPMYHPQRHNSIPRDPTVHATESAVMFTKVCFLIDNRSHRISFHGRFVLPLCDMSVDYEDFPQDRDEGVEQERKEQLNMQTDAIL